MEGSIQKHFRRGVVPHTTHLVSKGDLNIKSTLYVGGNLEVRGNLKAKKVICLGAMYVEGDIDVPEIICGIGITCKGNISTLNLQVLCKEDHGGYGTERNWDEFVLRVGEEVLTRGQGIFKKLLIAPKTLAGLDAAVDRFKGFNFESPVQCAGNLSCSDITLQCNVEVGGLFTSENANIYGYVEAGSVLAEGDLFVGGCLFVKSSSEVMGDLSCVDLHCLGNLTVWGHVENAEEFEILGNLDVGGNIADVDNIEVGGNILCKGSISASKSIKVGGFIASKKSIESGKDYAIFAGLNIPRSAWFEQGYVWAPKKPSNIFSGTYVTGKQKRPWKNR